MGQSNDAGTGLQPNVAGLLCYVLGWISGIIFLILENKNEYVRFHAIQSIIIFGALNIAWLVFWWIPWIGPIIAWIISAISFILWVVLMVKAYQGQKYKIPVAGDIAEQNSKPKS